MQTKSCENCNRIVENRGFSIHEFIEWPKDKAGKSHGNIDFCSLSCFIDWYIKNIVKGKE